MLIMNPHRHTLGLLLILLLHLNLGAASRPIHKNYRLLNEHEDEIQLDKTEIKTKTSTAKQILESHYSDDDDRFVEIDFLNKTVQKVMCAKCNIKFNPNCEHDPRPGDLSQTHYFPRNVERLLRKSSTTHTKDSPRCLKNDPELQMFRQVQGTVSPGGRCNPTPNAFPMCKHYDPVPEAVAVPHKYCYFSTKVSCKKTDGTCQALPNYIGWVGAEHFDLSNGCLNDKGIKYYKQQLLARFNNQDGTRLHNEKCEPFDDDTAEDRCMLVSDHAVKNYKSKAKPKPTCFKPTHLKCHPVLKKCICVSDQVDSSEIQFQFGNRSEICFIRPTTAWIPGFTCGGRSKSVKIRDKIVCKCERVDKLPYFNNECRQWWICESSRITGPRILVSLLLVVVAKSFVMVMQ